MSFSAEGGVLELEAGPSRVPFKTAVMGEGELEGRAWLRLGLGGAPMRTWVGSTSKGQGSRGRKGTGRPAVCSGTTERGMGGEWQRGLKRLGRVWGSHGVRGEMGLYCTVFTGGDLRLEGPGGRCVG